jgi:hypothetical protein
MPTLSKGVTQKKKGDKRILVSMVRSVNQYLCNNDATPMFSM